MVSAVEAGSPDPFLCLFDGGVGKSHEFKSGHGGSGVGLDRNYETVYSGHTGTVNQ